MLGLVQELFFMSRPYNHGKEQYDIIVTISDIVIWQEVSEN